jgi:hypothetical protein
MEVDVWVLLRRRSRFLWGLTLSRDDVQLAIQEGGSHAVHQAEGLDTAPTLGTLNDLFGDDRERCIVMPWRW